VHQIRFRLGLRPGPCWGSWFKAALLLRGGEDKEREGKMRGETREGGAPPPVTEGTGGKERRGRRKGAPA